ncbi:LPS export ABC transporter periplasmic protein LptC [Cellvibrio mixtus]|uniref:LPS export ABC transporter periplasmic protein LptC n=1 Tax=Cellvibrio mixtus TaxID=39650 RepID=UPI000A01A094|nr:LPS export ABC transporter periplasmic protein LptC [Cellvibrio mixtus]
MNPIQRLYRIHQQIPGPWIVAGVLVLGFFLFSLRHKEGPISHEYDPSRFPQIFMKQVQTREFDAEGKLNFELTTPQVALYQPDVEGPSARDYTLIDAPKMIFYNSQNGTPWRMSATHGRSEANNELIRLIGDVIIQQNSPTQGLMRVTTDELSVRTREQFAETDKAVKMRSAKGQIDALGMDADLVQSRLQLKSQVKAVYDPR